MALLLPSKMITGSGFSSEAASAAVCSPIWIIEEVDLLNQAQVKGGLGSWPRREADVITLI